MKRNCNFDLIEETHRVFSSSSTEFQSFQVKDMEKILSFFLQ